MTEKKKILTGRKALAERRDVARRNFQATVKGIADLLDWHLSREKFSRGRELFQRFRWMLDDAARRFTLTVEHLSDLEDQRTLFAESAFFVIPALAAAHQSGRSQVAGLISKLEKQRTALQKQKTAKARSAALAKRRPQKDAKVRITIECAKTYLANIQVKPNSRNALAVAIRPDIERKCKQSGITLPSVPSITEYLKAAGLA